MIDVAMYRRKFTFEENLERLPVAFEHGLTVDASQGISAFNSLRHSSCTVVGSGASFSASVYLAKLLEEFFSIPSKAQTPYEYYSGSNASAGVVLMSAAGKNQDILAALDRALLNQIDSLIIVTSKKESKLLDNARGFPKLFTVITGSLGTDEKEGFFGVQSLVSALGAFISMVPELRAQVKIPPQAWCNNICRAAQEYLEENSRTVEKIAAAEHVVGLATGWGVPGLVDFESKFVEGGLGWIEIAEGKNFTHGRFVNSWRRKKETAVVILGTQDSQGFLDSFQNTYESIFPILPLLSTHHSALGGLELFIYIFHLFNLLGKLRNVNISCPEIPDQARTMFRGNALYANIALRDELTTEIDITLELKRTLLRKQNISELEIERVVPRPVVAAAVADLFSATFNGFVCDYDGTLVSLEARDALLEPELVFHLERLLRAGICLAVITGRGGSALERLQLSINPSLHHLVYCYLNNGSVLKQLNADEPLMVHGLDNIELIERKLRDSRILRSSIKRLKVAKYRSQITADLVDQNHADETVRLINDVLADFHDKIQVKTSGHSIDIFPISISKGTACHDFKGRLDGVPVNRKFLIIGDSGQEDGNDFELLQQRFSLSVDRFHWIPTTCFPILDSSGETIFGPAGTIDVLERVVVQKQAFTLTARKSGG